MRYRPIVAAAVAMLLGACAIPAQPPGLLIATAPPGASCRLSGPGVAGAVVGPTPAIARGLESGSGVLVIACRRPGFAPTTRALPAPYPERVDIALQPAPPR